MKKLLAFLFFCLLFPVSGFAEQTPSIDLPKLESVLRDNQGKVVLLNFFATWCPPCKAEMPELVRLRGDFPEKEFALIGLSVDEDAAKVPDFLKNYGVNYPVYVAGKDITSAFRVNSVPHNAFFAPNGKMIISEPGLADANVLRQTISDLLKKMK